MILFCHILVGAAIAVKLDMPCLSFLLAFLSHYVLDCLPHWEYSIYSISSKQWRNTGKEFLKGIIDFLLGMLLVFALVKNQPIIFIAALFAVLPDGLTLLNLLFPNKFLTALSKFHKKTHWFTPLNPAKQEFRQRRNYLTGFKKTPFIKNKIIHISGILSQVLISILAVSIIIF
jgi:hypothetical protein